MSSTRYLILRRREAPLEGCGNRCERYSAAASYGLLLGHVDGDAAVSYHKQIADASWDSQVPLADHAALRVEARLNAGWLRGADTAPTAPRTEASHH